MTDAMELVEELEKAQAELKKARAELELARKIFRLVRDHDAWLSPAGDATDVSINCNDMFLPGADAERVLESEIDDVLAVAQRWPSAGVYAWCSVKRSEGLWRRSGREEWLREFDEAVAGIPAFLESLRSQSHA